VESHWNSQRYNLFRIRFGIKMVTFPLYVSLQPLLTGAPELAKARGCRRIVCGVSATTRIQAGPVIDGHPRSLGVRRVASQGDRCCPPPGNKERRRHFVPLLQALRMDCFGKLSAGDHDGAGHGLARSGPV
jgi:hypothetical protein